jgi:hypothetical protein
LKLRPFFLVKNKGITGNVTHLRVLKQSSLSIEL